MGDQRAQGVDGLVARGLDVWLGDTHALDGVCVDVGPGDVLAVLGASGSGKSTLLRVVAGLVEPDAGRVLLDGVDVTDRPPEVRGVGLVFQDHALFPHLTVADNIAFAASLRGADRSEQREVAERWLPRVGLDGMADRDPATLSGGQRQRVALARALASDPRVLLLDEPFGALDAPLRRQLGAMVHELVRHEDVPAVLVTHDREEALSLGDELAVLDEGRVRQHGPTADVLAEPVDALVAEAVGHVVVDDEAAATLGADPPPGPDHRLLVPAAAVRATTSGSGPSDVSAAHAPSGATVPVEVREATPDPDGARLRLALGRAAATLSLRLPAGATAPPRGTTMCVIVDTEQLRWLPLRR